jgi:hypothetical protein
LRPQYPKDSAVLVQDGGTDVRSSGIVPDQQEQTVMGTTADKIAGKIGSQLRSKIIDLSGLRGAH